MSLSKPILTILLLSLIIYVIYSLWLFPMLIGNAKLIHMVDPDTLVVQENGELKTVQLIGVDAPEKTGRAKTPQCYDDEALRQSAAIFAKTRQLSLATDGKAGEKDQYGRLLRYVYLADGTLYNQLLIKKGLAKESNPNNADYKFKNAFSKEQADAAAKANGIWDPQGCDGRF
jgi:micrococcal nuclease